MTEDEAKTKACPLLANEGFKAEETCTRCIGSHCMAWRWHDELDKNCTHGHCGLAGKP